MKSSIYSKVGKDKVEEVVNKSTFLSDVLRYFNRSTKGTGNFSTLKNYLITNNIPYNHLIENKKRKQIESLKRTNEKKKLKLEEILVENSSYKRASLKKRLVSEKLKEYKCSMCGIGPEWNGEKLTLELDHINGVCNDNRIENLRFLCPNCHSQTPTASGKHLKNGGFIKCLNCGKEVSSRRKTKLCFSCWLKSDGIHSDHLSKRKVNHPSKEELEKMIWERPCSVIAKELGISDVAIGKWCKRYGIKKPSRGYWTKRLVMKEETIIPSESGQKVTE